MKFSYKQAGVVCTHCSSSLTLDIWHFRPETTSCTHTTPMPTCAACASCKIYNFISWLYSKFELHLAYLQRSLIHQEKFKSSFLKKEAWPYFDSLCYLYTISALSIWCLFMLNQFSCHTLNSPALSQRVRLRNSFGSASIFRENSQITLNIDPQLLSWAVWCTSDGHFNETKWEKLVHSLPHHPPPWWHVDIWSVPPGLVL